MPSDSKLTPRRAVVFGLIAIACSVMPILAGLRLLPLKPATETPGWVGVIAGLAFLFAGAVILSYAAAGALGPDGQLLDTAPKWVRPFQSAMGLATVVSIASIISGVAFGNGERHFSVSISLPFVAGGKSGGDTLGRWAFGFMAVIMWCMVAGALVRAARNALANTRSDRVG